MEIREQFTAYIHQLQDRICKALEAGDGGGSFREDRWERPGGGGGRSRVIEKGKVFEKGGVNTSVVHGRLPQSMQEKFDTPHGEFFACGISLVIHPENPMIPTVHANFRLFELYDKEGEVADRWFGGGADLTPYYLFEEDARHFHNTFKKVCDAHHPGFYSRFKGECDAYFYNAHRGEARGLGGIFFDYCQNGDPLSAEAWLDFVCDAGDHFVESYLPIVNRRKNLPYSENQRYWQEIRRGRYVEFNLIHDRGTLFGLKTGGRTESILMSLPPRARWDYDFHPEAGSEEEKLLLSLKKPRNWVEK